MDCSIHLKQRLITAALVAGIKARRGWWRNRSASAWCHVERSRDISYSCL